ncbi:hypothetical protein [Cognatiyoonia sp.]|uniref:hypothetical protein n=1 Tax=Cognatiyoonia sp. TaxID=2211652 RepID=UPI003F6A3723
MNKRFLCFLALCPTLAFAASFDGVDKQTANSVCGLIGVDGGSIEIKGGISQGVKVQCRMNNPVSVIDMDAILYNMQCSGEGQVWTERAMLMNSAEDDELIMI